MKEAKNAVKKVRDLSKAKIAFTEKDKQKLKEAHELKNKFDDFDDQMDHYFPPEKASEKHKGTTGHYLKSMVYGGLDGIITTFAIVSAVAGSGLPTGVVIIMGFANLFADGISMGMGDYLSSQAEQQWAKAERAREEWETENYLEGEQREMIELWRAKGLSKEEAKTVIDILSQHKDLFIDIMMIEELGIVMEDESAWKHGVVTFIAFCLFGFVPLAVYLCFLGWSDPEGDVGFNLPFIVAIFFVALTLFSLGAIKSKFTNQRWWISGLLTLLYGGFAAFIAWLIGFVLEKTGLADEDCNSSSS